MFRTLWDAEQTYDDQRRRLTSSWSGYVIGPPNSGLYFFTNRPFRMAKWYGLLGSKNVIDTRRTGPIVVTMQFAPNNVLSSQSTAVVYTLSDLVMTIPQLPDGTPVPRSITFDNFTSMLQYNTTYNQVT